MALTGGKLVGEGQTYRDSLSDALSSSNFAGSILSNQKVQEKGKELRKKAVEIPPSSLDFPELEKHCRADCTRQFDPSAGLNYLPQDRKGGSSFILPSVSAVGTRL